MGLLEFLETNSLSMWLNQSPSIFAYPTLLAFHTFGMAFLVGISTSVALRMLGFLPGMPLAPLGKFFRIMWLAFSVSVVSGVLLLILQARNFLTMPSFYIKLLAIAVAVRSMRSLWAMMFSDRAAVYAGPMPRKAQVLAGAVLISWAVAITAGRVTAYIPSQGLQTAVAVLVLTVVLLGGGHIAVRLWRSKSRVQRGHVPPSTH